MSLDDTEGPRAAPRLDGHSHHRSRSRGWRRQEESTSGGVVTRAIKATLRFLWRCALQIFYFARFNVLLLLVVTAYACFFQGISLPIVTIKGDFMGQGSIDITKSTLESLENFFEEGFYLPGILVLLCSVVVPIVKLLMMFVIFFIRRSFPEKAHQLMFVLRIIAKYQMLDIFVTIIMVAFLNQDVMRTTLQTGFYYYLAFCLLSIGATQVLWSMLPDRPQALYAQQLARWMHDRQAEIAFKNLTGRSPGKYSSLMNNSYRSPEAHHSAAPGRGSIDNWERESPAGPSDSPGRGAAAEGVVAATPQRPEKPSKRTCSSPDEPHDVRISRTPSFGAASEPTSFRPPTPQGSKAAGGGRESPGDDSGALVVWPAPSTNRDPKANARAGDVSEITSVASSFNLAESKQKRSLIHSIASCGGCCCCCCHGFEFSLDTFFLYGACITFYIGVYWSLYHSVLTVKVAFKDSLIVSQSTLGLIGMIDVLVGQRGGINYIVPAVVFAVFALIIPCVQVSGIFLAGTLHVLPCHKTSHFCADTYRWLLYLIDYISDWAMMDVFSVAMFTTLISLNAFDALRADAPPGLLSGFYFLLMAGLASMDLATQTHELLMDAMARNVVEMATEMIIFEQEQEESLRNAEYPDIGITPKSVASSSIGWPIGDPDSRGAAIADRPNLVEEPGSTQAILPARCYQRTLSLPTEPAGGLSFAERLQAQLNSRDGNAQPDLPKPSSCAALTEPLLQPPSLGAKSATATFGDLGNRSEHGTDITSISRRDPSEWETFRVLRRELRRNASRVQKQASVALSAASSPPASPKRLKDSTGDIEEGRPSLPPTAVVQSSLMPATATESLVRRTKSMITLPRSRGSMVLADGQHLHPKHSLLSSLPAEQSLVAAGSIVSASPRKEKIPPVLQAAKRKVEQYVDMEAIAAATPRRHKDAGAASIGYDNEAKENKHYRLVATDESEGEEESNNSTADKAVPPLWKRLLQRMTGTVLIIKGVSWGIFFIVWSMHTTMPPVDLDVINLSLRGNLPLINGALQATLPSSLGACTSDSMHLAPKPCVGNSSLYYVRERVYEVNARWVSGLKTTKLDNIYLSVPQENRLALSIEGVIGELPLSLFVGQCVTPDTWFTGRCDKLWDNTDACCGTDKHFQVVLQSVCSEEYPFVRQITVENISVQQITIQEQFLGLISISLSDVTTTLQEALTKELQPFLMNNAFIPWGGQTLSLGELINKILALNINRDASGHERFECPKPPVGGFGPSQYEKQGVLERTFGGR